MRYGTRRSFDGQYRPVSRKCRGTVDRSPKRVLK
jgi:hypothetical protein